MNVALANRWLEEVRVDVLPNLPNSMPAKDAELLRAFDYEAAIVWLECVLFSSLLSSSIHCSCVHCTLLRSTLLHCSLDSNFGQAFVQLYSTYVRE